MRAIEEKATAEEKRLADDADRKANWKRWGPYLSERQWATVREDYSPDGSCWTYFPHDHARSRAYRWGEDGLLGICDRECRVCFAVALWNGKDPILKERLFGLTGPQGNHGEDVKESYFYLESTPTHSYMRALYQYPQAEFPYDQLVEENARRGRDQREFELEDTGVLAQSRYWDVYAEYAKAAPDDILIRLRVVNRGPDPATLHLLPTLWLRNSWAWGCDHEGCEARGQIDQAPTDKAGAAGSVGVVCRHPTMGPMRLDFESAANSAGPTLLFTENETNEKEVYGTDNGLPYTKDAFGRWLIQGEKDAVNPKASGTKCAGVYVLNLAAGGEAVVRLRLRPSGGGAGGGAAGAPGMPAKPFVGFDAIFDQRRSEYQQFMDSRIPASLNEQERAISRQAYSGLLWSKQFYHYVIDDWLDGDPLQPPPPPQRKTGRNCDWHGLFNRDVILMPDKWEFPWYAAWDWSFHAVTVSRIDPELAKEQLILLMREWYMAANGKIPAYEFSFSDINPPVHAWACWRTYKIGAAAGKRDRLFLERAFQKLIISFTWWVNRKDVRGNNIFGGGFLGLDNIGIFDRSQPLPSGSILEQADGTAWMAFFCGTMLSIALELAGEDPAYEDVASKFFEHFVAIVDAINSIGGSGLWDETDGFYYDQIRMGDVSKPLRLRSIVGLIPLMACEILDEQRIAKLPGFTKRMRWFLEHRKELARHVTYHPGNLAGGAGDSTPPDNAPSDGHGQYLLALPSRQRLARTLRYALDESEFLSPFGVRSLSRYYMDHPFVVDMVGLSNSVHYTPGESDNAMFGGNSNWRGPVWFPINFLLIESLQRFGHFYGDSLKVECPTGSGRWLNLRQVASDLCSRLTALFLPDATGHRPCHGDVERFASEPDCRDLILFYEHFHGDNGRGLGASHQTGWTSLVARCLESIAAERDLGCEIPTSGQAPAPGAAGASASAAAKRQPVVGQTSTT
jgi:hypothetical protein